MRCGLAIFEQAGKDLVEVGVHIQNIPGREEVVGW